MGTNVLWAGNIAGAPVVSIFNNPTGYEGNNDPVYNRFSNFDRIYLDSRFNYLTVRWQLDLTYLFNSVSLGGTGEKVSTIGFHNFGYPPVTILLDTDTREVITNNSYVQIVNYTSVRTLTLLMDNSKFYFKETYDNVLDDLPSITRRYTLLAFDNSAQVP
jgi:hypothetical protein